VSLVPTRINTTCISWFICTSICCGQFCEVKVQKCCVWPVLSSDPIYTCKFFPRSRTFFPATPCYTCTLASRERCVGRPRPLAKVLPPAASCSLIISSYTNAYSSLVPAADALCLSPGENAIVYALSYAGMRLLAELAWEGLRTS
jgi:hypothetical protein